MKGNYGIYNTNMDVLNIYIEIEDFHISWEKTNNFNFKSHGGK